MAREELNVLILHGQDESYLEVRDFIEDEGYTSRLLIEEHFTGTVIEQLRETVWDEIHAVVVILSGDDKMANAKLRARQNVIFELGYCFAAFDTIEDEDYFDPIIVIKEESVESFASIDGIRFIEYKRGKIKEIKNKLLDALDQIYDGASEYYEFEEEE